MSDKAIFFDAFLIGGVCITIFCAACYLFDKIEKHDDEIGRLNSRLESSQDHELKKIISSIYHV